MQWRDNFLSGVSPLAMPAQRREWKRTFLLHELVRAMVSMIESGDVKGTITSDIRYSFDRPPIFRLPAPKLAVQGRYNQSLCVGVSRLAVPYRALQSDRCLVV